MSLPFIAKKPIDLPPIVSVELIQISDKTNIPFAPKAKKIIEKVKKKEKPLHNVTLPKFSEFADVKEKKQAFFDFIRPHVEAENKKILQRSERSNR